MQILAPDWQEQTKLENGRSKNTFRSHDNCPMHTREIYYLHRHYQQLLPALMGVRALPPNGLAALMLEGEI